MKNITVFIGDNHIIILSFKPIRNSHKNFIVDKKPDSTGILDYCPFNMQSNRNLVMALNESSE